MGGSHSIGEATRKRNFHQKKFSGGESCTKLEAVFRDTPIGFLTIFPPISYLLGYVGFFHSDLTWWQWRCAIAHINIQIEKILRVSV